MTKATYVPESPSFTEIKNGHHMWDLSRRVPPRDLRLKLERLMKRTFELRCKIADGYYDDVAGNLVSAENAIYQAILGNVWRNEFHKRGAGTPKDSPWEKK